MNVLTTAQRATIVRALVEGTSVRAITRMTGHSKGTVLRLLAEVGEFASVYQDFSLRNLNTKRIEADEIWAYCGAKQRNATKAGQGDIWTYTALDADSKLMISFVVGARSHDTTKMFMLDIAQRLNNRVQLSTDGLSWYRAAVENAFGYHGVDFGQIIKSYGSSPDVSSPERKYSPMICTGIEKTVILGKPDMDLISTSYVERSNLTMRMGMRRFTRLTNGFSKKAENHMHAVALHFMHYNFCRAHITLSKAEGGIKTTPAMAAGIADHMWTVEEILEKMDPNFLLQ